MSKINFLNNLKEVIIDVLDWYKYATLKQQHMTMIFGGGLFGLVVGKIQRNRRIKDGEFSQDFELVGYNLNLNKTNTSNSSSSNSSSLDNNTDDVNIDNNNNSSEIINNFEYNWNKLARLAQKQPGYKYTKLYKAKYMDKSPIHYFKLRLWRNKEDLERFKNTEEYKNLRSKLDKSAKEVVFGSPSVVIDDSIRREIPYDTFF